jgi:hypothetical protein
VNNLRALSGTLFVCAAAAMFHQAPAQAAECLLPDVGAPIITVHPKPFTPPVPSTCEVGNLPGQPGGLPGYIEKIGRTAPIIINGITIGTLHDRVYCLGTGTTCDATNTFILATRVRMSPTASALNPNCPVWSGATTECFEINNFFRNIRGTSGAPQSAWVSYWMGTSNTTGTDPNTSLSAKYLEYTGKTYKGLNQVTPPGSDPPDRDNTKVMFWADTNVFDPDLSNSMWSPWLMVRQNCPTGGAADHYQLSTFAIKFWQGGEEGQIQQNIQASAYTCK